MIEKLMSHTVGIQNHLFLHLFTVGDFSEDELTELQFWALSCLRSARRLTGSV